MRGGKGGAGGWKVFWELKRCWMSGWLAKKTTKKNTLASNTIDSVQSLIIKLVFPRHIPDAPPPPPPFTRTCSCRDLPEWSWWVCDCCYSCALIWSAAPHDGGPSPSARMPTCQSTSIRHNFCFLLQGTWSQERGEK